MSNTLADYVTNATIRGLLGVSEDEVEEADFTALAEGHLLAVEMALEGINEDVPTLFETIKGIAAPSRTLLQQRFYSVVRLYSNYVIALDIAKGSVEMFAPIRLSDGKAEQERKDPYEALRAALQAGLQLWTTRLGTALQRLDSTKVPAAKTVVTYAGAVALGTDPVTGA